MAEESSQSEQQDTEQKGIRLEESSVASNFAGIQEDPLQQGLDSVNERTAISLQVAMKKSGKESIELGAGINDSHAILEVLKLSSPLQVLKDLSLLNKLWFETASELWKGLDLEMQDSSSKYPKQAFAPLFRERQTVAVLSFKSVAFLDLKANTWESKALSYRPRNESNSAYTVLLDGSLFCCGGRCYKYETGIYDTISDAAIIKRDGTVLLQSNMKYEKYSHGVTSIGERIFVFGGNRSSTEHNQHNEMYSVYNWIDLPDLQEPRWDFSPCVYKGLIYLSGGFNHTTEIFNPETWTFSLISGLDVLCLSTVSAIAEGRLIVLAKDCITKWEIDRSTIETVDCTLEVNAMCRPAVVDGLFYVLGYNDCAVIEIHTGEKRDCIPYWKSNKPSEETSGLEIGRNHYRSILEVLKLCSHFTVLSTLSFLNKRWSEASFSSELWLSFAEDYDISCDDPNCPRRSLLRQLTVTALLKDSIVCFNTLTKQWKSKPLSRQLGLGEINTYAILSDGSLFCCGGFMECAYAGVGYKPAISSANIIKRDGTVLPQQDMHLERYYHGVAAIEDNIFVFGGWTGSERRDIYHLRQCEMFVGDSWIGLPDMQKARTTISTSVHKGLIYICGNKDPTVEVFDPAAMCFSQILDFIIPDESAEISVVYRGCLVVLTKRHITTWDIEKEKQEVAKSVYHKHLLEDHDIADMLVRGTLVGNLLYLLTDFNKFNVIEIRTGKPRASFPLERRSSELTKDR